MITSSFSPLLLCRGCFLCSFSFFIHAHLYICASVDLRAGPALQPLLPTHLHQALASSSGMQGRETREERERERKRGGIEGEGERERNRGRGEREGE